MPTASALCASSPGVRSARTLYRLYAVAAVAATAATLAAILAVSRAISFRPEPMTTLLAACRQSLLPHLGLSHIVILLGGAVGVAVVVRGAHSAARHLWAGRCAVARFAVVRDLDGTTSARVVADSRPQAFCAGILRPRVYVSTGALTVLSASELAAVVEHEAHHAARRDPLRLLIAQVVSDALFFLPAMRQLRARYAALAELAADEAAIQRVGGPQPLAAAMLAFGEQPSGAVVGFSAERIDHLLGAAPRWEVSRSALAWMLVTVSAVAAAAVLLARSTQPAEVSAAMLLLQSCLLIILATPLVAGARGLRTLHAKRSASR